MAGLFLTLELIVANAVEPWLYGQSMGVSEIALLVSAAFWAFLWGPVGLVLSSPLTVCLVMLGRYVPQLEFLAVLLGDEPALDPSVSFYQRLLARDQDEAEDLILEHLKTESQEQVYDDMLVPTLQGRQAEPRARRHHRGGRAVCPAGRSEKSWRTWGTGGIAAHDAEREPGSGAIARRRRDRSRSAIFGCPAHDDADRAALEMLENLLDPARWNLEVIAPETLTAELLEKVAEKQPALVCLAATPPGGLAHTRYLCKRCGARFPDLRDPRVPLGLASEHDAQIPGQLREAGADSISATLLETRQQLASLLPVLAQTKVSRPHRLAAVSGQDRFRKRGTRPPRE